MRRLAAVAVMMVVAAWAAAPAFAQQESKDDLRKEVDQLKKEVESLKQAQETKPAAAPAPAKDESLMKLGEDSTILDTLLKETKVNGFVDVGYIWNFDRPDNGVNGNLPTATPGVPPLSGSVRAFDQKSRSFYLHNAQLNLNRAATKELITGYNVELSFGSDPNVFGAGPGGGGDYYDIQEANIEILAPVGNGISFRVGKFATFAGAEVIESKDNFNYSRSLPFFFAIPFTHTGARGTYAIDSEGKYSVSLGVNNGWDLIEDNNDAKTLEAQLFLNPIAWLKLYANFYYGAEKPPGPTFGDDNGDKRMLVDLVASISGIPGFEKFSAYLNVDIGEEEESSLVPTAAATPDDAEWFGFAVAGKYQLSDEWAVAARYSMIDDEEAFRTGGATPVGGTLDGIEIEEITVTVEYRISKDTIARVEFRTDMCDEDIFLDHSSPEDSQSTLGAEFILLFLDPYLSVRERATGAPARSRGPPPFFNTEDTKNRSVYSVSSGVNVTRPAAEASP